MTKTSQSLVSVLHPSEHRQKKPQNFECESMKSCDLTRDQWGLTRAVELIKEQKFVCRSTFENPRSEMWFRFSRDPS